MAGLEIHGGTSQSAPTDSGGKLIWFDADAKEALSWGYTDMGFAFGGADAADAIAYYTYHDILRADSTTKEAPSKIGIEAGTDEAPMSSATEAKIVDLICEGPIEGFSDAIGQTVRDLGSSYGYLEDQGGAAGNRSFTDMNRASKSIYLDDTPVKAENNFLNFRDFLCDFRPGYANQKPLGLGRTQGRTTHINKDLYPASKAWAGGMETARSLRSLESTLYTIPYTITDTNVAKAIVGINIRALSRTVMGKRTTNKTQETLNFLIYAGNEGEEYRDEDLTPLWAKKDSGKYETNKNHGGYKVVVGTGYVTSDYIFQIKIVLPPNPNRRNRIIRISRIDPPHHLKSTDSKTYAVGHAQFRSVTELLPYTFNHPHSALVSVAFDSRAYPSIPKRNYLLKLQKVKVPTNYSPETRKYVGNWDGQFKSKTSFLNLLKVEQSLTADRPHIYSRPSAVLVNPSDKTTVSTNRGALGYHGFLSFPLAGATPRPPNGATHGSDKVIRAYDGPGRSEELGRATSIPFNNYDIGEGGLSFLPLGSFGEQNFTIEFMIKVDHDDLKKIYDVDGSVQSTVGSPDVRKVIIASDNNSGMGASDIMSSASDEQTIDAGFALQSYGESNPYKNIGLNKNVSREFLDMGVLNAGWRIEVGTEEGGDPDSSLLGKVYFRSFSNNGMTKYIKRLEQGNVESFSLDRDTLDDAFNYVHYPNWNPNYEEFYNATTLVYLQNASESTGTSVLSDGKWHHIAVVRNGLTIQMFFDGELAERSDGTVTASAISPNMTGVNGVRMYGGEINDGGASLPAAGRGEVTIGGTRTPLTKVGSWFADTTFVGSLDNIRISLQNEYTRGTTYFSKDGSDIITGATLVSNEEFPKSTATTRLLARFDGGNLIDENRVVVDTNYFSDQIDSVNDTLLQWTDNPAWIYYDLATNSRYGMGKYGVDKSMLDKWSLYEISKYCDELVKTGYQARYKERSFVFVDDNKQSPSAGENVIDDPGGYWRKDKIGTSMIKISGFRNQDEFTKEFPEGSVINIYDLNDNKVKAHQKQIVYIRDQFNSPRRTTSADPPEAWDGSLYSYQSIDGPQEAASAQVGLIDLISVEDAIMLDFSLKDVLYVGYSLMEKNKIIDKISEKEFILGHILGNEGRGGLAASVLLKGSPVNKTSASGRVCCEFNKGYPFLEPRFRANVYIDSVSDGLKVLNDIAAIFRGITYYVGGKIVPTFDREKDPIMVFTNSNVKDGTFTYSGTPKDSRYTVCKVRYNDAKDFYKQRIEFIEDSNGVIRYGYNEKDLAALGCTSRGQARRLGKWFLYTAQHETESVVFSTGKQSAYLRPGDIIKLLDKNRISQRNFGTVVWRDAAAESKKRIRVDSEIDERLIGEKITIEIGQQFETVERLAFRADHNFVTNENTLGVDTAKIADEDIENLRKPQLISFTIKSIEKDTSVMPHQNTILELNEPDGDSEFFGKIKVGAAFSISRLNENIKIKEDLFRIINIKQIDQEEFELDCLEYNVSKHQSVDFSQDLDVGHQQGAESETRPAKMISSPKLNLVNSDPQNRQLLVSWDEVTPTPYVYHVVLYLVGEQVFDKGAGTTDSGGGLKVQHRAVYGSALGVVLPTNVVFNIGSFVGEIKVNIWTQDENGKKEVVYF